MGFLVCPVLLSPRGRRHSTVIDAGPPGGRRAAQMRATGDAAKGLPMPKVTAPRERFRLSVLVFPKRSAAG